MAILGVILKFFYVSFFVVWYHGLLFHVWDGGSVGLFFPCDKYLYCFCFVLGGKLE